MTAFIVYIVLASCFAAFTATSLVDEQDDFAGCCLLAFSSLLVGALWPLSVPVLACAGLLRLIAKSKRGGGPS